MLRGSLHNSLAQTSFQTGIKSSTGLLITAAGEYHGFLAGDNQPIYYYEIDPVYPDRPAVVSTVSERKLSRVPFNPCLTNFSLQ
jgi:hypothetical protein